MLEQNRGSLPVAGNRRNAPMLARIDATLAALDDVEGLTTLQRLKLTRELAGIRTDLGNGPSTLARLKLAKRLAEVRAQLGAGKKPAEVPPPPVDPEADADAIAAGLATRRDTRQFYTYDDDRKPAQRKRENDAAERLLQQIESGAIDAATLTDEQRQALAKWSGQGGNMEDLAGTKGSAYEYFTPAPIAEGVWNVLQELGFAGGRVLDPSCGTGVFGAMAPPNAAVEAIDLSPRSARVCQILNDGPGFRTTASSFEKVAAATPDESFDAIVTNIPFSDDVSARGVAALDDEKYQRETMESYFLKRSMEKLRPGGLAAYLVPTRIVSGKDAKSEALRAAMSMMGEFIGAYRLPSKVFQTTGTDVITDLIVFRKHSADAAEKIAELKEQNPGLLTAALVTWPEFIGGTYFQGEGLSHVIGTMGKAKGQWGEVDVLHSDLSMPEIAKLMRKLGGSRIDWAMLDAAPSEPIVYRDGDTMVHAGQTLRMENGRWVSMGSAIGDQEAQRELAAQGENLASALQAVVANVTLADALAYVAAMNRIGRQLDIPGWMNKFAPDLARCSPETRQAAWELGTVGLAVDQVEQQHVEAGFNFLEAYPTLSARMAAVSGAAKSPPKGLGKSIRDLVRKIGLRYDRATRGYSDYWTGATAEGDADHRTDEEKADAVRYQAASADGFVSIDEVRATAPDFDPIGSDDWCISGDGSRAARSGDYYVGNLGDLLRKIDAEIAAATDDAVREKLQRQKNMARGRCRVINYRNVQFSLSSPYMGDDEKLKFMTAFLDPRFTREYDPETEKTKYVFNGPSSNKTDREKLMARVAYYMNGGSISLGGADFANDKAALTELRRIINSADTQIDAWVKANPAIIGRLEKEANDPDRLYFEPEDDESELKIAGLHPDLKPHGYQNAYVRRMGRELAGINAFDVGLGKTLSALMAGQHALAIGSKKKVCWVVPASVLVNWRKEALIGKGKPGDADYRAPALAPSEAERCMFVGLVDRGGKLKTDSSQYDADLSKLRAGRHNKVFMSYEAFQRMRLREETAQAYESYLRSVDDTFAESLKNAEENKKAGRIARLSKMLVEDPNKSLSAPFFEDCGFDAVFFDEAHKLKNARVPLETKSAKYLSLPEPATVGMDASAKCWFVRSGNPRGDGVGLLTATPLTNSPAEIYSMLSLAVGDAKLNHMIGARGPDAFMSIVVQTEPDDTLTLDGEQKNMDFARKFVGLQNVDVLRNAIGQSALIKTAADVGMTIKVPTEAGEVTTVNITDQTTELLRVFKSAFRHAIDTENEVQPARGDPDDLARVEAMFGEPVALIAQPFNLINKMEQVALDPDLADRVAYFHFTEEQADAVAGLVAEWNKKPPTFTTEYPNTRVTPEMIVKRKAWETDTGVEHVTLTVQARAVIEGTTVVLVGNSHSISLDFDAMAEKRGVDFEFNVPPKMAALLANFQNEEANPRGRVGDKPSRRVRQIVFCDHLEVHAKLRRLLIKHAGVPSSAIAVIAGKVNGKPEDIQAVQDGFNDDSDNNKYRVILANERAEVGINLQIGTQAIHHLSYRGATPDGIQQRNGRGVRQGNTTGYVRVYRYDADGTFDAYKRAIIDTKASWIKEVLSKEGGNNVAISGQLSDSEYMAMIDSSDAGGSGMAGVIEKKRQAELLARAETSQQRQIVAAETIRSQRKWLERNKNAQRTVRLAIAELAFAIQRANAIERRMGQKGMNEDAIAGMARQLQEQRASIESMAAAIESSIDLKRRSAKDMATDILSAALEKKRTATMEDLKARAMGNGSGWSGNLRDNQFGALVENSTLVNAWAAEKKVAEDMVEESGRIILREADANVGGYSARAHAVIMAGEFSVTGGKLWMRGTVFEFADTLGVVTDGESTVSIKKDTGEPIYRSPTVTMLAGSKGTKVFNHEQAGWTDIVKRMAAAEDAYAAGGNVASNRDSFPSTYVAEVGQYRTVQTMTLWGSSDVMLPSPKFPIAIRPDFAEDGSLAAAIVADQGLQWSTNSWDKSKFVAPSDSVFTPVDRATIQATVTAALLDEARRRGMKVTRADGNAVSYFKPSMALKPGEHPTVGDAMAGAATVEEADTRVLAWLRQIVDDAVAVESWAGSVDNTLYQFAPEQNSLYSSVRQAIQQARREAERQQMAEEQARAAAERAAAEAQTGNVWGWIVGDTFRFKAAVQGGVRAVMGMGEPPYPVAWKGKDGQSKGSDAQVAVKVPTAPPNSWITTKAGFDFMQAKYPREAGGLSFTPAN